MAYHGYTTKASYEGAPNRSLRIARLASDLGGLVSDAYIDLGDTSRRIIPRKTHHATLLGSTEFTRYYGEHTKNPSEILDILKKSEGDFFTSKLMTMTTGITLLGSNARPSVALALDDSVTDERSAIKEIIDSHLGIKTSWDGDDGTDWQPHITLAETTDQQTAADLIKILKASGRLPSYILLDPAKHAVKT
ncbi:hypothetical protein KBD11_01070 [Candidatus Saccharibacteria bacterium]|nr:hypothetical protein [Candidatus Saccharibacteria bacterium]